MYVVAIHNPFLMTIQLMFLVSALILEYHKVKRLILQSTMESGAFLYTPLGGQ